MELKEILGEDLYNQVAEQLKGKGPQGKDIELVATNTGDYVPAAKYEALKEKFTKVDTDYKTLNSNYESKLSEISASREKDIKKILVENELAKANVLKVNNNYDYVINSIGLDKLSLDGSKLVDTDNVLNGFLTANPQLVMKQQTAQTPNAQTEQKPAVPAASGLNPTSSANSVKDRAYYQSAYNKAISLEDKMSIKRQAGEEGILI